MITFDHGVTFREIEAGDLNLLRQWRNHPDIVRWNRQQNLVTEIDQDNWLKRINSNPNVKMYGILTSTDRLLGVCGLTSIDWVARNGEISLYIRPDHQREGHGTDATRTLVDHAFKNLNLNRVYSESLANNPGIKILKYLNFKEYGVHPQQYWKDNKFQDAIFLSVSRTEWGC